MILVPSCCPELAPPRADLLEALELGEAGQDRCPASWTRHVL
ncbi:MAG: hypothetical protein ABSB76_35930 [Streptosporangiaceae bacterium]